MYGLADIRLKSEDLPRDTMAEQMLEAMAEHFAGHAEDKGA